MTKKAIQPQKHVQCTARIRAVHDTLDLLGGKWKITIISSLSFNEKRRFMELQRDVEGIGAKMLSKELKELEVNELVIRTVYDTKPVTVEYELTPYGKTLQSVINEMAKWGTMHRKRIIKQSNEKGKAA